MSIQEECDGYSVVDAKALLDGMRARGEKVMPETLEWLLVGKVIQSAMNSLEKTTKKTVDKLVEEKGKKRKGKKNAAV